MNKFLMVGAALVLFMVAAPVMATTYPDRSLSGGFQAGHFNDVYDLTAGNITLSFTYDGNGLVDDDGAHAWAELGVRSDKSGASDFNPYWTGTVCSYEYDLQTATLYAGQNIPVGDVLVWGDGETLYVKYVITEPGWVITKENLAVADSLDGIPQAKGNPVPGRFEFCSVYDPPVTETPDLYEIDLTRWDEGVPLYIAAHADVMKAIDGCWESVWMIGDVEAYTCGGGTLLSNYMDEFNVIGSSACALDNGYSPYQAPPFANPFVVGVNSDDQFPFMSDYAAVHNPADPYTRGSERYGTDFDVQWDGALPLGGKLTLSWSPGQSAKEIKVISGDGIATPQTFTAYGVNTPGQGWFLDRYPLVENTLSVETLAAGVHTFRFQHTTGDGTFWDWVKLERPCEQRETAWAGGLPFPGKNWATYFIYTPTETCESVEGSGVWLATDYDWTPNTFDPDATPNLDLDDKLILQRKGGEGEAAYNLPSVPPVPGNNHRFWWDRDGVDPWQNDATANTGGIYQIVITLHATGDTTGTAYMNIRGLDQGFETDGNWNTIELTPAGMTWGGDMKHLVVFYGLYGYGATHSVAFRDITVMQA